MPRVGRSAGWIGACSLGIAILAISVAGATTWAPFWPSLTQDQAYEVWATRADLVVVGELLSVRDTIPPRDGPMTTVIVVAPTHVILGSVAMTPIEVHIPEPFSSERDNAYVAARSPDARVLLSCVRIGRHWGVYEAGLHVLSGVVPLGSVDLPDVERRLLEARARGGLAEVARASELVVRGRFIGEWLHGGEGEVFKTLLVDSVIAGRAPSDPRLDVRWLANDFRDSSESVVFLKRAEGGSGWVESHPTRALFRLSPGDHSVDGHSWPEFLRLVRSARLTLPRDAP